jgi:hypothetical protein
MKEIFLFFFLTLFICAPAFAQSGGFNVDSIKAATNEDYKNMLAQLDIKSLREGPSGNPQAPNAANTTGPNWSTFLKYAEKYIK